MAIPSRKSTGTPAAVGVLGARPRNPGNLCSNAGLQPCIGSAASRAAKNNVMGRQECQKHHIKYHYGIFYILAAHTIMVNNPRQGPTYALAEVSIAVRAGDLRYHGRRVQIDTGNLGFHFEDVCACLLNLGLHQFDGVVQYPLANGAELMCDTYLTRHCARSQSVPDDLYIKFFMKDPLLFLCSFHRPR